MIYQNRRITYSTALSVQLL